MLNIVLSILIMAISISAGSLLSFVAWNTMYPDKGHLAAKIAVNLFTAFIFLAFIVLGVGGISGFYD